VLAGGLVFYPLVGMCVGALAAAVAGAVGVVRPGLAGPAGVLALAALGGLRPWYGLAAATALLRPGAGPALLHRLRGRPGAAGAAIALGMLAVKLRAAAVLPAAALTTGLLFAPMLGAWAIVVQCYGGVPVHARHPASALVGRARFREFAGASLVALGVALGVADALGLVVALAAALVTVGLRVYAYHRLGGLTGRLLAATREVVETVVLVVLGLLARAPVA
jgi:adenosylcobinamide-GDP ribazoletransferase